MTQFFAKTTITNTSHASTLLVEKVKIYVNYQMDVHFNAFPCAREDQKQFHQGEYEFAFHTCSTKPLCPVQATFMNEFKNLTGNPSAALYSSLCKALHALFDAKPTAVQNQIELNIIVLGGSVTAGTMTGGNRCFPPEELPDGKERKELNSSMGPSKCKLFHNDAEAVQHFASAQHHLVHWPRYLELWLLRKFPHVKVNMYNWGDRGRHSPHAAEYLIANLRIANITLTPRDIIFLDYSVNDALFLADAKGNQAMFNGLRSILAAVVEYSTSRSELPAIILLESFPYSSSNNYRERLIDGLPDSPSTAPFNYMQVYRAFSRLYSVPLWSFYNLLWSPSFAKEMGNLSATEQLKFRGQLRKNIHPPWHFHLFFADLVAAAMVDEHERCTSSTKAPNANRGSALHKMLRMQVESDSETMGFCKNRTSKDHLLLDMQAFLAVLESRMTKSSTRVNLGVVRASPAHRWPLTEDGPRRYGWIETNQLETSSEKALMFTFRETPPLTGRVEYVLDIRYVRSYNNFGAADVMVDGSVVGHLDGLWESTTIGRKNVTIPDQFLASVTLDKTLQTHEVRIIYRNITCHCCEKGWEEECIVRKIQKMRITAARLCRSFPLT